MSSFKGVLLFILLIVLTFKLIATPQICFTELKYNSKTYNLVSPLNNYPNVTKKLERKLNVLLKCSACWIGYSSSWEIIDSTLYLTSIYSPCHKNVDLHKGVEKVVKERFIDRKLKASWFNDTLWFTTESILVDSSFNFSPIKSKTYKYAPLKQIGLVP